MQIQIITKDVQGNIIKDPRENNKGAKYVRIVHDIEKDKYVKRIQEKIALHERNIEELQAQLLALTEQEMI